MITPGPGEYTWEALKKLLLRIGMCQPWRGAPRGGTQTPTVQEADQAQRWREKRVGPASETPWDSEPGCGRWHGLHLFSDSSGLCSLRPAPHPL